MPIHWRERRLRILNLLIPFGAGIYLLGNAAEDFTTHLGSTRVVGNFTPDLAWSNVIQYDSISDSVGYNSRMQWEYLPGSRLFLVVNQNYFSEDLRLKLTDTEMALKVGAIFRF